MLVILESSRAVQAIELRRTGERDGQRPALYRQVQGRAIAVTEHGHRRQNVPGIGGGISSNSSLQP